jgi:hypothetical protein
MRSAKVFYASLITAALALPLAAPASATVAIAIDKSSQHMTVSVDGTERYSWPISTGRPGYETPSGTFKPNRMDADHFSQEWDNAPMPHAIFFDLHGHAVHGFFDVKHLGLPVSHGCVRLSPDNATTLFTLVKAEGMANTTVTVSGRTPGGNGQEIARRAPDQETVYGQPGYGQQGYAQPAYGQSNYDQFGRPQSAFPPQPPPYGYNRPAYGAQPSYGQQQQPNYGQQDYQQPLYSGRPY